MATGGGWDPVFEAVLISHTSRRGELVNISDLFLPDAAGAAQRGGQSLTNLSASLKLPARRAVAIAAGALDEQLSEEQIESADGVRNPSPPISDLAAWQAFRAPVLMGDRKRGSFGCRWTGTTPSLLGRRI